VFERRKGQESPLLKNRFVGTDRYGKLEAVGERQEQGVGGPGRKRGVAAVVGGGAHAGRRGVVQHLAEAVSGKSAPESGAQAVAEADATEGGHVDDGRVRQVTQCPLEAAAEARSELAPGERQRRVLQGRENR